MTQPAWTRLWTWWAVVGAVWILTFILFEGIALIRDSYGDTLTETVVWLRDENRWLYWLIVDVVTLTGIVMPWLVFHFRFWSR